jgi:hypothetical protein
MGLPVNNHVYFKDFIMSKINTELNPQDNKSIDYKINDIIGVISYNEYNKFRNMDSILFYHYFINNYINGSINSNYHVDKVLECYSEGVAGMGNNFWREMVVNILPYNRVISQYIYLDNSTNFRVIYVLLKRILLLREYTSHIDERDENYGGYVKNRVLYYTYNLKDNYNNIYKILIILSLYRSNYNESNIILNILSLYNGKYNGFNEILLYVLHDLSYNSLETFLYLLHNKIVPILSILRVYYKYNIMILKNMIDKYLSIMIVFPHPSEYYFLPIISELIKNDKIRNIIRNILMGIRNMFIGINVSRYNQLVSIVG